jgi:hypothetical protein
MYKISVAARNIPAIQKMLICVVADRYAVSAIWFVLSGYTSPSPPPHKSIDTDVPIHIIFWYVDRMDLQARMRSNTVSIGPAAGWNSHI